MDFVVVRVNGKTPDEKSLEETLETMCQSNKSVIVELKRKNWPNSQADHILTNLNSQADHVFTNLNSNTDHSLKNNKPSGKFQTHFDKMATTSTIASDYICIDNLGDRMDHMDHMDDMDEEEDDDYDDLELWCGSKEMSSNFITHVTNCKICSEASNLHLSILENLQYLEESESDEDNDDDDENNNAEYDEVADEMKSFESDSALDDSMAHETYRSESEFLYSSSLPIKNDIPAQNLKNARHNSTDTNFTEGSSNQDDSAIGRTDDSLKTDESSEQELLDSYAGRHPFCLSKSYHFESSTHLSSSDLSSENNSIGKNCNVINGLSEKLSSTNLSSSLIPVRILRRNRMVPRMGTRITRNPANELPISFTDQTEDDPIWLRQSNVEFTSPVRGQNNPANGNFKSENPRSCCSSKSSLSDHSRESLRSVILKESSETGISSLHEGDLAAYTPLKTNQRPPPVPKKCLRLDTNSSPRQSKSSGKNVSFNISENQFLPTSDNIDEENYMHLTNVINGNVMNHARKSKIENCPPEKNEILQGVSEAQQKDELQNCEMLRKLYAQHIDVMYTNQANLEHTMMVQQKLFSQQIQLLQKVNKNKIVSNSEQNSSEKDLIPCHIPHEDGESTKQTRAVEMQWVMKKRPDGSRYVTRRPVKKQRLKKRAERLCEERRGMTTDDDAASEMKIGKYWTKEERREQVREKRNRMKAKMETLREQEDTRQHHRHRTSEKDKNERSGHKSGTKEGHKIEVPLPFNKRQLQTLMGKNGNKLLSVTTV